jgi:phage recombination protein Bet
MAQNNFALATMEEDKAVAILGKSLYPNAKKESIALVLSYCKARNLDPFQKPVHIVPMGGQDVIMPSIDFYRLQASRSGALAGISEPEFSYDNNGQLESCRVTVKRLLPTGNVAEFSAREYLAECQGKSPIWRSRPRGMLAKCAESQALRRAFPEFSSGPSAEEMDGKGSPDEALQTPMTIDDERFLQRALAEANNGTVAFRAFYKDTKKEDRALIRKYYPDLMKSICDAADARLSAEAVVEVEDVEVVTPVEADYNIKQNADGTYSW